MHIAPDIARAKRDGDPKAKKTSRLFANQDGRLRAADGGRGGWRLPTALDIALSTPPALQLGGFRVEG